MSMTASEIIAAIKDSPLTDEEMGQIMSAATTKIMANAFVAGGLDMMSDPSIWGEAQTGVMPGLCGVSGEGHARGHRCARDEGHPYNGKTALHRSEKGELW